MNNDMPVSAFNRVVSFYFIILPLLSAILAYSSELRKSSRNYASGVCVCADHARGSDNGFPVSFFFQNISSYFFYFLVSSNNKFKEEGVPSGSLPNPIFFFKNLFREILIATKSIFG